MSLWILRIILPFLEKITFERVASTRPPRDISTKRGSPSNSSLINAAGRRFGADTDWLIALLPVYGIGSTTLHCLASILRPPTLTFWVKACGRIAMTRESRPTRACPSRLLAPKARRIRKISLPNNLEAQFCAKPSRARAINSLFFEGRFKGETFCSKISSYLWELSMRNVKQLKDG